MRLTGRVVEVVIFTGNSSPIPAIDWNSVKPANLRRITWYSVLAVLLMLVAVGTRTPGAANPAVSMAPAAAAVPPNAEALHVMTWNICGEAGGAVGSDAYCPYRNDPQYKADVIAQAVATKHINALLLQEVCFDSPNKDSDLDLLQADLQKQDPAWEVAYTTMDRPNDGGYNCRGALAGGSLGVAIAVKGHITEQVATQLAPYSAVSSQSKLLCVRVSGWQTRVCALHMPVATAGLSSEVSTVLGVIGNDPQVVLGGDFNTTYGSGVPADLKPLYDFFGANGSGGECDAQSYAASDAVNEATHFTPSWTLSATGAVTAVSYSSSKLDYLFGSDGFTQCDSWTQLADQANYANTMTPSGISDHAPLYGTTAGRSVPMPPSGLVTVPAPTAGDPTDCGATTPVTVDSLTPFLQAHVSDSDSAEPVHAEFSIWDDTDTTQPQPITLGGPGSASTVVTGAGTAAVLVPTKLIPGHLYGWRVRAVDSSGTDSATTANCHFYVAADAQ